MIPAIDSPVLHPNSRFSEPAVNSAHVPREMCRRRENSGLACISIARESKFDRARNFKPGFTGRTQTQTVQLRRTRSIFGLWNSLNGIWVATRCINAR